MVNTGGRGLQVDAMHLSVSLLSFQPQHGERAVHSSTVLQKHCEMCFNFLTNYVIAGLLLSLFGAEMITEAKTYTKKIIKKSEVGENDQVMVCIGDKLVAQYFCNAGICWSKPNTVGQLKEQSGNLVLIMQNISPIDRFDAFHNRKPILQNFTLDEVPPTSTTPSLAKESHSQRHLEPPNMTDTTKALIGVGVTLAALVAVRRRIARAIAFFTRRSCDPAPNQHEENSMEMQSLAAPV